MATYSYRASGQRAVTSFGGTTTNYVFSGNQVLAKYANGSLSQEYIYLGNLLLAEYRSGTLLYNLFDRYSIRTTTDANGNKVEEQDHFSYLEQWYMTNTTTKWVFTRFRRPSGFELLGFIFSNEGPTI